MSATLSAGPVELDRLDAALQVLRRFHFEIADRVGQRRQRRRQDGKLAAWGKTMQQAGADRRLAVPDDNGPLHHRVRLVGAETRASSSPSNSGVGRVRLSAEYCCST